jgi:hypothetical protein
MSYRKMTRYDTHIVSDYYLPIFCYICIIIQGDSEISLEKNG